MDAEFTPRKRRPKKQRRRGYGRRRKAYKGSALEAFNKKRAKITKKKAKHPKRRVNVRRNYAADPRDGARCARCGAVVHGVRGRAPTIAKLKAHYVRKHPDASYEWTMGLSAAEHKQFMKHSKYKGHTKHRKRRG